MAVIIIAPPLLNYATLVRERQLLQPENHTLYDIGFGQKMHMSCLGHGTFDLRKRMQGFFLRLTLIRFARDGRT